MIYEDFLKSKFLKIQQSGFTAHNLNHGLKDFQKYGVETALRAGKFALFFDCGLGKTFCQLEWAYQVFNHTGLKPLILAPLAVVEQTKQEAIKFGYKTDFFDIINYDRLSELDTSNYPCVVLDESSILKSKEGKTSNLILDKFNHTPYKLACSATPSPNDHMELGMHSQFLNGMSYQEILAMYFVHDGGETSKWRLRKHAEDDFWKYVCTWSMAIDNPATLGFNGADYHLPEIEYIEHFIDVENKSQMLFGDAAVSATDLHKDLKKSFASRIKKTIDLVNSDNNQWIVWALGNNETDELKNSIQNSVNVQGSDKSEFKAKNLLGFANNQFRVLITKTKIASMGMNYQNCHNMVFMSYDFKFEQFYQAVRRCYRFGQNHKVKVHLLIPETQLNVRKTILEKQANHFNMIRQMAKYSANNDYKKNQSERQYKNQKIKLPSFL